MIPLISYDSICGLEYYERRKLLLSNWLCRPETFPMVWHLRWKDWGMLPQSQLCRYLVHRETIGNDYSMVLVLETWASSLQFCRGQAK